MSIPLHDLLHDATRTVVWKALSFVPMEALVTAMSTEVAIVRLDGTAFGASIVLKNSKTSTTTMTFPTKSKRVEMVVASTVSMEGAVKPWR